MVGVAGVRRVRGRVGGIREKCAVGGEDVHGCLDRVARDKRYGALRYCRLSVQVTVGASGFI